MSVSIFLKTLQAQFLYAAGLLRPEPGGYRILMYHRITTPEEEPYPFEPGMYVSPQTFRMHLEYLCEHYDVISIDSLVKSVSAGEKFSRPTVSITFDDGLADNYNNAFPLLRDFKVPATIFLATSYIGTMRHFWSNALQAYVTSGLDLAPIREILASNAIEEAAQLLTSIPSDSRMQRELVSKITFAVKSKDKEIRNKVISELQPYFAVHEANLPRQFLTWEEAAEMGAHGITFGSHTHTHAPLPDLSEAGMAEEISESLRLIRAHNLPESRVFCYPGGYANEKTQEALSRFNFTASLLTRNALSSGTFPAFTRTGVHEDMTKTPAMLAKRLR